MSDDNLEGPSPSTLETQLHQTVHDFKALSNRQVELFDRLQHLEERFDALLDRVRKCEDRMTALGRKPTGLR